jgi:PIN domain nuclease of toxin-antitoxin system
VRYFIDTNIFIFLCASPDYLDPEVSVLFNYENQFVMSVESVRELLMLLKSGKTNSKKWNSYDDIKSLMDQHNIEVRHTTDSHLKTLDRLIPAPNHSDPADLMIIAQAITEKIPLISSDTKFPLYTKQGLELILNRRKGR